MEEKNTPKLRFTEFNDSWKLKKIMDLLLLVSRPIKMKDEEKYNLVTVKRRHNGVEERGLYYGKDILVKSQYKLKQHDFIISKRQIVHDAFGIVPKYLDGAIVSNEYSVFTPKENLNIIFFDYFTNRPKISHSFYLSSIGVHIEKMLFKVDDWLKRRYYFPTLAEQQKIADFLSSVDQKIQQLRRKKELLEVYKKGVMQKLFSQEIRFKDENGEEFPDWVQKRFDKFASFYSGGTPSTGNKNYYEGNIPFIRSGEIESENTELFINQEAINNSSAKLVSKGDLLMALYGANSGDIAISKMDGAINQAVLYINSDQITEYLYNYLKFNKEKIVSKYLQGGQGNLSATIIKSLRIPLPSKYEQVMIAKFLSKIDAKINLIDSKIQKFQTFKKGLLQQMFV